MVTVVVIADDDHCSCFRETISNDGNDRAPLFHGYSSVCVLLAGDGKCGERGECDESESECTWNEGNETKQNMFYIFRFQRRKHLFHFRLVNSRRFVAVVLCFGFIDTATFVCLCVIFFLFHKSLVFGGYQVPTATCTSERSKRKPVKWLD